MKKTFSVYIFRHGQTSYNKNGMFTGLMDPPITPLGRKQAHTVALRLKNAQFQIAIQTELKRSKQTLHEVLKYHKNQKIKIITDRRMRERDYGTLDRTTHEHFIKLYGIKEYNRIHRDYNARPPKGESFADVEKRVRPFVRDLRKLIKKHQTNVVISAHGNSIRLFRKILERASKEKACKWSIPYDKVYRYKISV